ncbi:MAG: hypothetical protein AAFZ92_05635, partial [Pseudomonadota bacterium]
MMPILLALRNDDEFDAADKKISQLPADNLTRLAWNGLNKFRNATRPRPATLNDAYNVFLEETKTGKFSTAFTHLSDSEQQALLLTVLPVPGGVAGPEFNVELMFGGKIAGGFELGKRWLEALPNTQQADTLAIMYLRLLERYPPTGEPPAYDKRIHSLSALVKDLMRGMSADEQANTFAALYLRLLKKYPPKGKPPVHDKRISFLNTLAVDLMRGKSAADRAAFAATLVDNDPVKLANIVDNLLEKVVRQGSTTTPVMAETWIEILKYSSAEDIRQTLRGLQDPLLVDQIVALVFADGNDYLSAEELEKWNNVFALPPLELVSLLVAIMTAEKAETLIINPLDETDPTRVAWYEIKPIATATGTTDLQRIHELRSLIVEPPAGPQRQLFTELLTMDIGFAEKFIDAAFPINSQTHRDYLSEIIRIEEETGITDLQRIHKLKSLIAEPAAGPQPQLLAELMTMNLGDAKKFIDAAFPADSATHKAWSALIAYKDTLMHINNLKDAYAVLVNLKPYTPEAIDLRSLTNEQQAALIAFIPNTNTAFYLMQAMSSAAREYLFDHYPVQAMLILSTEETGDKAQARIHARKAILDTLPESHRIKQLWDFLSDISSRYNTLANQQQSPAKFYTGLISEPEMYIGNFGTVIGELLDSDDQSDKIIGIVNLFMSGLPRATAKALVNVFVFDDVYKIVSYLQKIPDSASEDFLKFFIENKDARKANVFIAFTDLRTLPLLVKILAAEPTFLSVNAFEEIVTKYLTDASFSIASKNNVLSLFAKILIEGNKQTVSAGMKAWLNQLAPEPMGEFIADLYGHVNKLLGNPADSDRAKYLEARDRLDAVIAEISQAMADQDRELMLSKLAVFDRSRILNPGVYAGLSPADTQTVIDMKNQLLSAYNTEPTSVVSVYEQLLANAKDPNNSITHDLLAHALMALPDIAKVLIQEDAVAPAEVFALIMTMPDAAAFVSTLTPTNRTRQAWDALSAYASALGNGTRVKQAYTAFTDAPVVNSPAFTGLSAEEKLALLLLLTPDKFKGALDQMTEDAKDDVLGVATPDAMVAMLVRLERSDADAIVSTYADTHPVAEAWAALVRLNKLLHGSGQAGTRARSNPSAKGLADDLRNNVSGTYAAFLAFIKGDDGDHTRIKRKFDALSATEQGALLGLLTGNDLHDYLRSDLELVTNVSILKAIDSIDPNLLMNAVFAGEAHEAESIINNLGPLSTAGTLWRALKAYAENYFDGSAPVHGPASAQDIQNKYEDFVSDPSTAISSPKFTSLAPQRKMALLALLPQRTAISAVNAMTAEAKTDLFSLDSGIHLALPLLLAMDSSQSGPIIELLPGFSRMVDVLDALDQYAKARDISRDQAYTHLLNLPAETATSPEFKSLSTRQQASLIFSLLPPLAADAVRSLPPEEKNTLLLAAEPYQVLPALIYLHRNDNTLLTNILDNSLFIISPINTVWQALKNLGDEPIEDTYASFISTPEKFTAADTFSTLPTEQRAALLGLLPPSRATLILRSLDINVLKPLLKSEASRHILMPILLATDANDVINLFRTAGEDNILYETWRALGKFANEAEMDRRDVYADMINKPADIFSASAFRNLSAQEKRVMVFILPPARAAEALSLILPEDLADVLSDPYLAVPALLMDNDAETILKDVPATHPVRETWEALKVFKDTSGSNSLLEAYIEFTQIFTGYRIEYEELATLEFNQQMSLIKLLPYTMRKSSRNKLFISFSKINENLRESFLFLLNGYGEGKDPQQVINQTITYSPLRETWQALQIFAKKAELSWRDAYTLFDTSTETTVQSPAFTQLTARQQWALLNLLEIDAFQPTLSSLTPEQRDRIFSVVSPTEVAGKLLAMDSNKVEELINLLPEDNLVRRSWNALIKFANSKTTPSETITADQAFKMIINEPRLLFDSSDLDLQEKSALTLLLPTKIAKEIFINQDYTQLAKQLLLQKYAGPYVMMPILLASKDYEGFEPINNYISQL